MSDSETIIERAVAAAILFSALPPVGQPLEGGTFCGIVTATNGEHQAVVLLDAKPDARKTWKDATAWAESVGGQLPTRPVAALLYANAKAHFESDWYWTNEVEGRSSAWYCSFGTGDQFWLAQHGKGCARAVRLIRVSA